MADQILQIAFSLIMVVGIIVGGGFLLRRFGQVKISTPGPMKIISSLNIGLKEKLLLVQVGETQILMAASTAGLQTVHVFSEPAVTADSEPLSVFQQKLQTMMSADGVT
ncbi:MAG: flagellar protein FliO/FliZ [Candidatus Azotimanducaceae bacterium]|jgi:flagellar protein FliO/FliZ